MAKAAPTTPEPAREDDFKPLVDALMASQEANAQASQMMLAKLSETVEAQVEASKALSESLEAQRSDADPSPALDTLTQISNDSAKLSSEIITQLSNAVEMLRNPARPRAYNFSIKRDDRGLMTEVIATPDDYLDRRLGTDPTRHHGPRTEARGLSLLNRRSD